ncbi:hypothetical protein E2C01_048953 [Portunus trituberculatus]|uniref:Uncharacterized protein n=1 Tax=Portunus trituberculatus TaxID=210409 RepID=A0A5B7GCM1_PORTR|nr:hypothetical protein [Portunus trituberculatus]
MEGRTQASKVVCVKRERVAGGGGRSAGLGSCAVTHLCEGSELQQHATHPDAGDEEQGRTWPEEPGTSGAAQVNAALYRQQSQCSPLR